VLIVGGGATLGYALTQKAEVAEISGDAKAAMASAIAQLDGEISGARGKVSDVATTLSTLQPVVAVVVTDEASAKDAYDRGELKFGTQAGELIEIGQLIGTKRKTLLVQPDAKAMPDSHGGTAGSYTQLMDGKFRITEVVHVTPKKAEIRDGGKLTGYVMVSRPLDLEPAFKRLTDANVSGYLQMGGEKSQFGNLASGADTETVPLPSVASAQLVVSAPKQTVAKGPPMPVVGAGAGAAGLGLVVIIIGMMTGKKKLQPAPQNSIQGMTTVQSVPPDDANTKLSGHGVASGTPSPVTGTSSFNPSNLGAGAMIGRWEVVRRLGSGGMADVYLARSRGEAGFEKLVAIKVMHSHLARNERAVSHFLDEARLSSRIVHPNVVAIQDLGKIGDDYVIVMEYVEGVDLERLLAAAREANRQIPVDVGLGILCRICDGLTAAHTATGQDGTPLGVIHRDVKAANVLVSRQGGVKVVDFGIAKAASQSHLTVAGETKGTPSMMAPEQRVGEKVDVRADVYSVAAVGFEILTGNGVNLDLAALAHLGVENWPHLPLPSSLRPNLPIELDEILLTAMSFEREKRPADCVVFEAMFEKVMKKHGLTASDKDIARWIDGELRLLQPPFEGTTSMAGSKPANVTKPGVS
jgi:hypothetical protein